jgi:DNA (cytosine-5)-methyltransferase 1
MDVISLFSGAGGMDRGFIEAGHTIIWANDHDPDAVRTYRANIGQHIVEGNIENIDASVIPDADILIGGFPCQGFSVANLRRSTDDERNKLYRELLRILSTKKPKYFLAENVRGILSLDGGQVISLIVQDLSYCGYDVEYRALNAVNYGVPQNRSRVIIVGKRKDIAQGFQFPDATHAQNSSYLNKWITISEALAGIPEPNEEHCLSNHICSQYKVTNRNFTGHRTTDPNKPSPTILARGNGKGGVCAIQHPRNHRRLSVRESALIQTFPIEFTFYGSLNSMYRQVGNAVPVRFARKLAEQFRELEGCWI